MRNKKKFPKRFHKDILCVNVIPSSGIDVTVFLFFSSSSFTEYKVILTWDFFFHLSSSLKKPKEYFHFYHKNVQWKLFTYLVHKWSLYPQNYATYFEECHILVTDILPQRSNPHELYFTVSYPLSLFLSSILTHSMWYDILSESFCFYACYGTFPIYKLQWYLCVIFCCQFLFSK